MRMGFILLMLMAAQACQYRELGISTTLPKEASLQLDCLAKAKTVSPITDQLGAIIYFEKLAFISLPPPYTDNIHYLPCNLPDGLRNGQKVRFSARVKYQPEIVNGAIIDYIGQEIELTRLTLL